VEPPPHSLDLALSNFFLFSRIKNMLKGEHFEDADEIKSNMAFALNGISENDFQACFQSRRTCMQRCVYMQKENTSKVTILNCNKFRKYIFKKLSLFIGQTSYIFQCGPLAKKAEQP
jgi:hypothetical protein